MARLCCFVLLHVYAVASAVGAEPAAVRTDITRHREGETDYLYVADNSPIARGDLLRAALAEAQPGDRLDIGVGLFDVGYEKGQVVLPKDVMVVGQGPSVTKLLSRVFSDEQGTAFNLSDGTVLENMSIECRTHAEKEDGRTIGFDPFPDNPAPRTAHIKNCRLIGNDWTIYTWNNEGHHLVVEDSEIVHGRVGVAAMASGGATSQFIDIIRCKFRGDASLSDSIGATSDIKYGGVFGVIARGGQVRIIDCEMELKGQTVKWPSWTPRIAAVTDTFHDNPSGGTHIEIMNLRAHIVPNGVNPVNCLDLDIRDPKIRKQMRVIGGWGAAQDGGLSQWRPH